MAARAYALQNIALIDAGVACWDSKYAYWAIRPCQLASSYPAAHGCASNAEAVILGYLFPRDAAALAALPEEARESRVWAGIHEAVGSASGSINRQQLGLRSIRLCHPDRAGAGSSPDSAPDQYNPASRSAFIELAL
jgi:hypothetical protein